ncbi:hypothetical protein [Streptomyces sp. NPDC002172]
MPHNLPPTGAVRYCSDVWKRDGLDARINEVLRTMVREKAGRAADPSQEQQANLVRQRSLRQRAQPAGMLRTARGRAIF